MVGFGLAGLVAVGVALWGWQGGATSPQPAVAQAAASAPATVHAAVAPAAAASAVTGTLPAAVLASMPLSVPMQAHAASGTQAEEVCGLGRVRLDAPDQLEALGRSLERQALDDLRRHAIASADPRVRALPAFMASEEDGRDLPRRRDELARAAAAGRDPVLYMLAMWACQPVAEGAAPGACQLLSRQRWAQLDPGNAAVWLELAADASARGRPQEVDEALYRASLAERWDEGRALLPALVDEALPPSAPGWQRPLLTVHAFGVEAAVAMPGLHVLRDFCRAERVADANRRQTCEALAQGLLAHGTTLMDQRIARAVGGALGWPAERLAALQRESEALQGAALAESERMTGFDCEHADAMRRWVRRTREHGELGALHLRIEASGLGVAHWAEAARATQAAAYAAFASAAAAASAASAP